VNYDYRCPFARNAHEHVVAGLRAGAPWEVEFVPFSLTQAHVEEGGTPVWEDPDKASHLVAIEAGLVVRDTDPEHFLDLHLGLFAARHDLGRDLRDEAVVREVLERAGVDADDVLDTVGGGEPRQAFRKAHEAAVADHHVFGVPTFVVGDRAVFVRIMTRPDGDGARSQATVEGVLSLLVDRPELNEFKHTTIPR
jgi:predicted DsbA family dithiol-disulfide isomerase